MTSQEIIDKLKTMRKEAGLSQAALAERCGRPQNWAARIELGKANLRIEWIEEWTAACGKPMGVALIPKGNPLPRLDSYDWLPVRIRAAIMLLIEEHTP